MSTIKQLHEKTSKLIADGHGDLPVICIDGCSGDSNELNLSTSVTNFDGDPYNIYCGMLCDEEEGFKFIKGFIG